MKSWKYYEKKIEEWLQAHGLPAVRLSASHRGEAVNDITIDDKAMVEVKTRKEMPALISQAMEQAEANDTTGIPIVILHKDHTATKDDIACIRLGVFVRLLKKGLDYDN